METRFIIEPEIHLWGEELLLSKVKTIENVCIRGGNELGEIMTRGRYKGRSAPFGSCQLITPGDIELKDRIMWMAEFTFLNKEKFEQAGATDIVFWIYWTGLQGNVAFTPREMKMLAKLNIPLCIDYMFDKTKTE
jgi:hypothetical protein